MNKLAISLPTRGRPERVVETVSRSILNWQHPNTVLWVMADADDFATQAAMQNALPEWRKIGRNVQISVKEREDTIGAKWNRILELEPQADIYLAGADDDPYTTPGYDVRILEAGSKFPDGIGMVYGHMANASFSRAVAPTRKLAEKLGWMFPEYFPFWFVDHWTDDLAKLIGRISFADIMTDQTKPGKTQELRESSWWATWFDAAYLMRRKQAHDIIDSPDFQEPDWRKNVLKSNAPLIEFHSRWTNNHVRNMARDLDIWSGLSTQDARYQRLKIRALQMVPHLLNDYGMPDEERMFFARALLPQAIPNIKQAWAA